MNTPSGRELILLKTFHFHFIVKFFLYAGKFLLFLTLLLQRQRIHPFSLPNYNIAYLNSPLMYFPSYGAQFSLIFFKEKFYGMIYQLLIVFVLTSI